MPTKSQQDAAYHCDIGNLLTAAYQREFNMLDKGKCKRKFPRFADWYATLNDDQLARVDGYFDGICIQTLKNQPRK